VSLRGRLNSMERALRQRGLLDKDVCPACGGGGSGHSTSSRLHLGSEPPTICEQCGGPIDFTGRGLAKTWKWVRFARQPDKEPDTSRADN